MTPSENTRVLRREQRHAWRGMKRGRHARPVKVTFGQQHRLRAQAEAWAAMRAAWRESRREDAA
jgi:hypothetical protein